MPEIIQLARPGERVCNECKFNLAGFVEGKRLPIKCEIGYKQFPKTPVAIVHSILNNAEVCNKLRALVKE